MSRPWRPRNYKKRSKKTINNNNNINNNCSSHFGGENNSTPDNQITGPPDKDDGDDNDKDSTSQLSVDDPLLNVYAIDEDESRYRGCKLYFNIDDISKDYALVNKVEASKKFFSRNPQIPSTISSGGPAFNVNVDCLYQDHEFISEWDTFASDLHDNPDETLNCLGLGLHQVIIKMPTSLSKPRENLKMLRVKIFNYRPLILASDIKVSNYGKLVATRGCVIRVGRARQLAEWLIFICIACKAYSVFKQPNGIYTLPKRCKECGKGKFTPKLDSPYVTTVAYQIIKLQEHLDSLQDDKGKMPRILEVELFDDLADTCSPGDDITVVGIVKVRGTDDGIAKGRDSCLSTNNALYMEAVSIVDNKNKSQRKNLTGMDLSADDLMAIKKIHDQQDEILPLLVRSLCPTIYGHEMIKMGLLLSLFGGTGTSTCRDDIHVIIVGDPGLGKTQMLQACSRIASQGVYVCGNASTSSGLTVTLTKEAGSTDFALEPGALVLADSGCCVIDEFDKMPMQHRALLEAMEQQSVSVAKSGIICSLEARTSILAAANPIGGRYDTSKPLIDNLNLSQPLLSRFDLIFLLLDRPSEDQDFMMCVHVMNGHKGGFKRIQKQSDDSDESQTSVADKYLTLRDRLSISGNFDIVPQILLRKYVAYARQYVKPKMTEAAGVILKKFYLELRESAHIFGSLPIFNRQLEALIRLTQARAKLELRTETVERDALEIVDLFKYTISSVPQVQFSSQLRSDSGKLTVNKVRAFIKLLRDQVKSGERRFSKTDLQEIAIQGGILVQDFRRFVHKLNEEGIILKRGQDIYEFVSD